MKTRLPIRYRLRGLPKRHKTIKEWEFREWVDVDIKEMDPDTVPVVLKHKYRDETTEVRWHDGKFWSLYSTYDEISEEDIMSLNSAENEGDVKGSLTNFAGSRQIEQILKEGVHVFDPETFSADGTFAREKELERIEKTVASSMMLNGELWKAQRSPILTYQNRNRASFNFHNQNTSGVLGALNAAQPHSYSPLERLAFSVNKSREDIEDTIRAFNWEGDITHPDVDVLMPDVFTLDVDAYQMKLCAREVLQDLWRNELKRCDQNVYKANSTIFQQILNLKAVMEIKQPLDQAANEIADQIADFIENLSIEDIPEFWHRDALESMTLLTKWWQERDLEIDFNPQPFK